MAELVGARQLVYGSDRPVAEPPRLGEEAGIDWETLADASVRAFAVDADELAGVV